MYIISTYDLKEKKKGIYWTWSDICLHLISWQVITSGFKPNTLIFLMVVILWNKFP